MRANYDFVPHIGNGLSPERLDEIRSQAVRGSHIESILQEALLDRSYDLNVLERALAYVEDDVIMTSFPNERYRGYSLLFRSEFLVLSCVGNGAFDVDKDVDPFVQHVCRKIEIVKPRNIIYRLCDYNNDDFAFLDHSSRAITSRGAQRLLDQPQLLQMDLQVVRAITQLGVAVHLLIPCIQLPQQYTAIRKIIDNELDSVNSVVSVGVMLEIPANLFQTEDYAGADFFIFGPSDLLKYFYGGLDRNTHLFEDANSEITLFPIEHCLSCLNLATRNKNVYLAKSLVTKRDRLGLARFNNIRFKNLYMPPQLIVRGQ